MKTLLLSLLKERFYWEKNTHQHRQGWMNYILYDSHYVYEKYFENLSDMQKFMIDKIAAERFTIDCYVVLWNERVTKRKIKEKKKLQAKYASKFKRKQWWNYR